MGSNFVCRWNPKLTIGTLVSIVGEGKQPYPPLHSPPNTSIPIHMKTVPLELLQSQPTNANYNDPTTTMTTPHNYATTMKGLNLPTTSTEPTITMTITTK